MHAFRIVMEARNPKRNCFRSYCIEAGRDLFGDWMIDVNYGRIGTAGTWQRYSAKDEAGAIRLVQQKISRRSSATRRIGVSYQICEIEDLRNWAL